MDPFHLSTSTDYHRSHSSSRPIESSLRVYRQVVPMSIPENEPLTFPQDDFDDREEFSCKSNSSDLLFTSPRGRSSNISQTIKQNSRVYPKTVSRLLASSPAHQNQYRVNRAIGLAIPQITTNPVDTAASVSPCLSPIRYALDHSQMNPMTSQTDEELHPMTNDPNPNQFLSLPNDDGSVKVCFIIVSSFVPENVIIFILVDFSGTEHVS